MLSKKFFFVLLILYPQFLILMELSDSIQSGKKVRALKDISFKAISKNIEKVLKKENYEEINTFLMSTPQELTTQYMVWCLRGKFKRRPLVFNPLSSVFISQDHKYLCCAGNKNIFNDETARYHSVFKIEVFKNKNNKQIVDYYDTEQFFLAKPQFSPDANYCAYISAAKKRINIKLHHIFNEKKMEFVKEGSLLHCDISFPNNLKCVAVVGDQVSLITLPDCVEEQIIFQDCIEWLKPLSNKHVIFKPLLGSPAGKLADRFKGYLYDLEQNENVQTFYAGRDVLVHERKFAATSQQSIFVHEVDENNIAKTIFLKLAPVTAMCINPDGLLIALICLIKNVFYLKIFDLYSNELLHEAKWDKESRPGTMYWSQDQKEFLIGSHKIEGNDSVYFSYKPNNLRVGLFFKKFFAEQKTSADVNL